MATSKNNRKKGRKRSASHAAPPGYDGKKQQYTAKEEQNKSFFDRHLMAIKWIGLLIMLAGFIIAYYLQRMIGYPITIVGALIGFFCVRSDTRYRRVSLVCYGVYIALMVYAWITLS